MLGFQEAADARDDVQVTLPTDDDEKEVTLLTKEEDDEAGPPLPVLSPHQTSPTDQTVGFELSIPWREQGMLHLNLAQSNGARI